jgi:hypothetical protein
LESVDRIAGGDEPDPVSTQARAGSRDDVGQVEVPLGKRCVPHRFAEPLVPRFDAPAMAHHHPVRVALGQPSLQRPVCFQFAL